MKKVFSSFLLSIIALSVLGQDVQSTVIDTIDSENGKILMYSNHTWGYLDDHHFDGILNWDIHEQVSLDSLYNFQSHWSSDDVITCSTNDISLLKDTIWLCVLDSLHEDYAIPFDGLTTSRYGYRRGRRHNGIDIDLETGDTIFAAFDGKVRYAQYHDQGFGNLVVLRHYNGLETYYGHCDKLLVVPNQLVKAGEPIGLGGNTGRSTGSHLHFEVRFYDNPIDPEFIFDFEKDEVRSNLFVHSGVFAPGGYSSANTAQYNVGGGTANLNATTHRVRYGESLWTISRKYGTSISKLCRLNGIKETDILKIGQTIKLR
jgi:LysM repeat protein